jgi:hypothetical protein
MDDQILPLDLTIYGAVYQHEARKATALPLNPNTIWSGVYTVKFKKVPGPPPLSDGTFFPNIAVELLLTLHLRLCRGRPVS